MQYYNSGLPLSIRLKLMLERESPELMSQPLMNNSMVEAMRMKGASARRKIQLETALATKKRRFSSIEQIRSENRSRMETFPVIHSAAARRAAAF